MPHFLVKQLHFARGEFARGLEGLTDQEARTRFGQMNCISWMVGHLAMQENFYWVRLAQGIKIHPELVELVGVGKPASTPPLEEMWAAWRVVTAQADEYLLTASESDLAAHLEWRGEPRPENSGTTMLRNIYHYWFHLGEALAIRQQLGHQNLPEFVGNIGEAAYGK